MQLLNDISWSLNWICKLLYSNLDDTTRTVYKENIKYAEELSGRIKEAEALRKIHSRIKEENNLLLAEKENSEALIAEKANDRKRKEAIQSRVS